METTLQRSWLASQNAWPSLSSSGDFRLSPKKHIRLDKLLIICSTGGIMAYDAAIRIWYGGKRIGVSYNADRLNKEWALQIT